MTTGIVWDESFAWHDTGTSALFIPAGGYVQPDRHAEDPETKRRFRNLLEKSGLTPHLTAITAQPATEDDILRFHTADYLERVKRANVTGAEVGPLTVCARGSYEIALLSAGGVIAAVDAVLMRMVDDAYALVRPPGHHAVPHEGQGFCIFGNAVIAARHAMKIHGLAKVAFVDWDIHHGNGTEAGFWNDPSGLTISIHQDRFFPADRGLVHQWGEEAGEGYNINIPLPPGSGVGAYKAAFEQVVIPALYAYRPELIIVPSGFDGGAFDPLGRNMMTSEGFRTLTRMLKLAAQDLCNGRLVFCHEGGYSRATVPFMGLAVMEELSGVRTDVTDPFIAMAEGFGGQDLQPHQQAVIDQSRQVLNIALLRS